MVLKIRSSAKYLVWIVVLSIVPIGIWCFNVYHNHRVFQDAKNCSDFGYCYSLSKAVCELCRKLNAGSLKYSRWRMVERMAANERLKVGNHLSIELVFAESTQLVSNACGDFSVLPQTSLGEVLVSLPSSPRDLICTRHEGHIVFSGPALPFAAVMNESIMQLTSAEVIYFFEKNPVAVTSSEESKTFIIIFKPDVTQSDVEGFIADHQLTPLNTYDMGPNFRGMAVKLSLVALQAVGRDLRVRAVEAEQEIRLDAPNPVSNSGGERLQ
jgi:hypothetical protein